MNTQSGKRLSGRLIGAAIVLVWIVLIGFLIARQRISKPEPTSGGIPPVLLEEQWMSVRFMGQKVGWARQIYKPVPDGYLIKIETRLGIKVMGVGQEMEISMETEVSEELHVRNFSLNLSSPSLIPIAAHHDFSSQCLHSNNFSSISMKELSGLQYQLDYLPRHRGAPGILPILFITDRVEDLPQFAPSPAVVGHHHLVQLSI